MKWPFTIQQLTYIYECAATGERPVVLLDISHYGELPRVIIDITQLYNYDYSPVQRTGITTYTYTQQVITKESPEGELIPWTNYYIDLQMTTSYEEEVSEIGNQ